MALIASPFALMGACGGDDTTGGGTGGSAGAGTAGNGSSGTTAGNGSAGTTAGSSAGGSSAGNGGSSAGNAGSGGSSAGSAGSAGGAAEGGAGAKTDGGGETSTAAVTCTTAGDPFVGKTCSDFCTQWVATCMPITMWATKYASKDACLADCSGFAVARLCCRGYHANNAAEATGDMKSAHCGHATGLGPCDGK